MRQISYSNKKTESLQDISNLMWGLKKKESAHKKYNFIQLKLGTWWRCMEQWLSSCQTKSSDSTQKTDDEHDHDLS